MTGPRVPAWALGPVEPHCCRCRWPVLRAAGDVVHAFSLSPYCWTLRHQWGQRDDDLVRERHTLQPSGDVPERGRAEPWPPRNDNSPVETSAPATGENATSVQMQGAGP